MRRLAVLAAAAILAAAAAWLAARHYLDTPLVTDGEARIVNVQPGASLTASAEAMAEQGLLDHPQLFAWYARLRGDGRSIQAGEYSVGPGTTPRALLEQLVSGRVLLHALTVVEGWTFAELLAALRAHPAVAHTLAEVDGAAVMAALDEPERHPEGLFFPET